MTEGLFTQLQIPLDAQIRCVEREIAMREKVYARWVEEKKLTQKVADREIAGMKAVLETLKSLQSKP
jgi:hypothetical protein